MADPRYKNGLHKSFILGSFETVYRDHRIVLSLSGYEWHICVFEPGDEYYWTCKPPRNLRAADILEAVKEQIDEDLDTIPFDGRPGPGQLPEVQDQPGYVGLGQEGI